MNAILTKKEEVIYKAVKEMVKQSDNIVFRGSFFFQKMLGYFYREYNDIDFSLDIDMDKKEKIIKVRDILSHINKEVICILREKKSFYQYAFCYFEPVENNFVRLECLVVAPHNKYIEKYTLINPSDANDFIEINVCTLEKMFVDKYFSLYYFLSEAYKGEEGRIECAVEDICELMKHARISKFLKDYVYFEELVLDKIREDNIMHFNQYGFILYAKHSEIAKRLSQLFFTKNTEEKNRLELVHSMATKVFEGRNCKEELEKWKR